MMRNMLIAAVIMVLVARGGWAQEPTLHASQKLRTYSIAEMPTPGALDSAPQPAPSPRDSVRNGALIGAIVGAVGTFAFGMYLCHAIREEGDPPCLKPALVLTALGAGAGAAAGAGIDALATRPTMIRLSVRF